MENSATATFAENIKAATAKAHTDLEALPVSVSVMNPAINNAEYITYLTLMRDIVKDAEENVFPILSSVVPDLEARNKAHFIDADLTYLGAETTATHNAFSTGLENVSVPFALGAFYVIEGSSLGGRVILKNINKALGHNEENGATYFAGYGHLTGPRWKQFTELLSAYEAETNTGAEIIDGANYAFEAIHRHFAQEQN
ncbi:MAG: biliverdin-producing heme oxygenase [Bacteroidia bacterium]